jgi:hypothetical protein
MPEPSIETLSQHHHDSAGCAFIIGDNQSRRFCGQSRRLGSPYCPEHHALCHVRCGTSEETRRLREVEALASAIGGRRSRAGGGPSRQFLKRLENVVRDFP